MNKKSKVTSVFPSIDTTTGQQKSWTNNGGNAFYFYTVQFENNDIGEYMSVKANQQDKFTPGEETEYTLEVTQYGNRIKPVSKQGDFHRGRSTGTKNTIPEETIALKNATEWCVALVNNGKKDLQTKHVVEVAKLFLQFLKNDATDAKKTPTNQPQEMTIENAPPADQFTEDGLPF